MDLSLTTYLETCEPCYDAAAAMLAVTVHSPGYHTRIPDGTRAHPTREALHYALALLQAGGKDREARAAAVVGKLLELQDTDPFSGTYGIWSWYLEEPLSAMAPPDWNWADFCGALLAQMLTHHAAQLPAALVTRMRVALGHAAWAIFRRNVRLDYTNIAIMGGGVAAAAGELLGEPRLTDFGRERLRRVIALAQDYGSFPEYNSPTYTMVVLHECERILHVVRDAGVRDAARALCTMTWEVIATHYHPGTQQWAGPHARAYNDRVSSGLAAYLARATGVPVATHPAAVSSSDATLVPVVPCPPALCGRFRHLPESPCELSGRFIRRDERPAEPQAKYSSDALFDRSIPPRVRHRYGDRRGTTWFSDAVALGSVNHEDTWTQRRVLLGYLRTEADPAVVLRLRFLHDGRDFASGFVRQAQRGPRVLSAVTVVTNRGDWHPHFDHPADDVFAAGDFRLRYELSGRGVGGGSAFEGGHALTAGAHRIVVQATPGVFAGREIAWECGRDGDRVWVDAVCYHGPRQGFPLQAFEGMTVVGALEVLEADAPATAGPVRVSRPAADGYRAEWAGLTLDVPAGLDVYPG